MRFHLVQSKAWLTDEEAVQIERLGFRTIPIPRSSVGLTYVRDPSKWNKQAQDTEQVVELEVYDLDQLLYLIEKCGPIIIFNDEDGPAIRIYNSYIE